MLEVRDIHAGYGPARVLHGLSFTAKRGEILCLAGRNGAGKTTALKAVMGHLPLSGGRVALGGQDLGKLAPHEIPTHGIGYVPQGRRLFGDMTVAENLEIGLMARNSPRMVRDRVLAAFPRLGERLHQRAATLSGGEQQMLAMGRALCLEPSVLLLDEPTEGLQPSMTELIRSSLAALKAEGVAIVLVEQRVDAVLALADHVAFVENGRNGQTVTAAALRADSDLMRRYVGI